MSLSADRVLAGPAQDVATVTDYARRVYRRADGVDEVVPADFAPDWDDRPAMFALYSGVDSIALAGPDGLADHYAQRRLHGDQVEQRVDFATLSTLLYLAAAPLRRKLELSWNSKAPPTGFNQQEYRRGSASGGGLYPTQIYLVCGGDPLPAGVYRYDPGHHRLIPLRRGDQRAALAAAAAVPAGSSAQCYLVLTTDLWQNCFKYSNFGYHVCTQDVGAMLATIELALTGFGIVRGARTRFDDAAVSDTVEAADGQEIPLVILSIGRDRAPPPPAGAAIPASVPRPRQRSRHVLVPQALRDVHRATMLNAVDVPIAVDALPPPGADATVPFDEALLDRLPAVLLDRRSAWGGMRPATPLLATMLGKLLAFMSRHGCAAAAIEDDGVPAGSLELMVQSLNVDGLPAGAYRWDAARAAFDPVAGSSPAAWQSTYAMLNYNIDEAGCLIFVTGDFGCMIERHGARGYRVLNTRVGMMAQLAYMGAAALSIDCGVVLGARAQRVKQLLAVAETRDVMLAIYVGGVANPTEVFDFQFLRSARS